MADRRRWRAVRYAGVWLLLAGVGLGQAWAERVEIGMTLPSASTVHFFLAKERGLFQEQGLEVRFIFMTTPLSIKAVAAGSLDYAGTLGSTIPAAVSGLPVKVVAVTSNKPFFWFVSKPEFKTPTELKGKRIGVSSFGATEHHIIKLIVKRYGLDPDRDLVYLQVGGSPLRLAALKAGSIDAAILTIPHDSIAVKQGFRRLAFSGDYVELAQNGLTASDKAIRERPEQIKRVIKGLIRTIAFAKHNREEMVRFIVKLLKVEAEVAEQVYHYSRDSWPDNAIGSEEAIRGNLRVVKETADMADTVPLEKVADFRMARQAFQELR